MHTPAHMSTHMQAHTHTINKEAEAKGQGDLPKATQLVAEPELLGWCKSNRSFAIESR